MTFNPKDYIVQIKGNDFMKAPHRVLWFRHDNPKGRIITEMLNLDPPVFRAEIFDENGILLATGSGVALDNGKQVWSGRAIEKAETAAISRALAHAGYGTQFTNEDDLDHLSDSPINSNPEKNNGKQQISWPSSESVKWVMDKFRKQKISDIEILRLAGVSAFDDGDGWRKYDDAQSAVLHVQTTLDAGINNSDSPNNHEHVGTFRWMNYIGKTSNMQFMSNEPGTKNNTVAILYGGRGAIRGWGGDELYEQLNLSQYDAIKGKNTVSDFIPMTISVNFHFVDEERNGEHYFKVTGISGDPSIPF